MLKQIKLFFMLLIFTFAVANVLAFIYTLALIWMSAFFNSTHGFLDFVRLHATVLPIVLGPSIVILLIGYGFIQFIRFIFRK